MPVKPGGNVVISLDKDYKESIVKGMIANAYATHPDYKNRQWAVLCLVQDPAWHGTHVKADFAALHEAGMCAKPVTWGPTTKEHAESKLFEFLDIHYDYKTLPTILLYTHLSPCSTCGNDYVTKLKEMAKKAAGTIELDIVYSFLYKINDKHSPFYDPDGSKMYNSNLEAFKALQKSTKKSVITIEKYP